jgi:hypothetical protein
MVTKLFSLKVGSFSMVDGGTLEKAINVQAGMKIVTKVTSSAILGCKRHSYYLSNKNVF